MKHTGINETSTSIYLVETTVISKNSRSRDGLSFSVKGESYTDRAEAQAAYDAAKLTFENVALKVKRPGSKNYMPRKAGE